MQRLLLLILLGTAAAPAALGADSITGIIQICRAPQPGDAHVGKTIEIPLGASFGDTGYSADHRGNYWPLWIVTMEPVTIDVAEACGKTPARITSNLDKHAIRTTDYRWFTPTIGEVGILPGWPGNLLLAATALTDFR
jgi:hypothetical protein